MVLSVSLVVGTRYARTGCSSALGDSSDSWKPGEKSARDCCVQVRVTCFHNWGLFWEILLHPLAVPPAALERGECAGSVPVACGTSPGRHSCEVGPRAEARESAQPRLVP